MNVLRNRITNIHNNFGSYTHHIKINNSYLGIVFLM